MSGFGKNEPYMIAIWVIMSVVMFAILATSIVLNLVFNKQYKKGVFTTRKVTLFATFMSILIVQTVIDVYIPNIPGMPSFEALTTITIGFLFGPVEGIIFGWTADFLIVLINGWAYQILPGMMMPMTGLIAGLIGWVYWNRNEFKKWVSISIFQVVLLLMMIIMLITSLTIVDISNGYTGGWQHIDLEKLSIIAPISCSITILILEGIFFYLLFKGIDTRELFLLTLLLAVAISERTVELVVRPFSQVYYYSGMIYFIEFYMRLLRSSYLIPTVTITSYLLITTTIHVLDFERTLRVEGNAEIREVQSTKDTSTKIRESN